MSHHDQASWLNVFTFDVPLIMPYLVYDPTACSKLSMVSLASHDPATAFVARSIATPFEVFEQSMKALLHHINVFGIANDDDIVFGCIVK